MQLQLVGLPALILVCRAVLLVSWPFLAKSLSRVPFAKLPFLVKKAAAAARSAPWLSLCAMRSIARAASMLLSHQASQRLMLPSTGTGPQEGAAAP